MNTNDRTAAATREMDATTSLAALDVDRAAELGEEARELARLLSAGVPVARGVVVRITADGEESSARDAVRLTLGDGSSARLRPLASTRLVGALLESTLPLLSDVTSESSELDAYLEAFASDELRSALSGRAAFVPLRVLACDADSGGRATSTDPVNGDPDVLGVLATTSTRPYRIDRRSGRVIELGDGVDTRTAEEVADVVDRAQLVLGRPLEIEWAVSEGRVVLVSVAPESILRRFVSGHYRRVALVAADEGTVAPLAIDALDRGLSQGARVPGMTVRRIYARPYRKLDVPGRLLGAEAAPLPVAVRAAGRVAYETTRAFSIDNAFLRTLPSRLDELARADVRAASDAELLSLLDTRHAVVAEAFARLDESRESTRRTIVALEETVGPLPREVYPALSTPKLSRQRTRAVSALVDLARRVPAEGDGSPRANLASSVARKWDAVRDELALLRPLGIDIAPEAFGASDRALVSALRGTPRRRPDALERARWEAMRHVLGMARQRPMGAARAGLASSLGLALERIVSTKGKLSEALASAMGLLREAAIEVGARLANRAILDAPEDALYLTQAELVDALSGEPGAHASRVRVRREDDARWIHFDAPRRLEG